TQAHHALTTAISTDFGATWTSQQHPFDDQIIATYTPLNNAQRVYVLTLPKYTFQSNDEVPRNYPRTIKAVTLWKSDNAGRTWRTQSTITLPQPCRIDISEPNMGYVYSADSCYYKNYTIEFVDMPTRYTAPNTVAVAIRYANHALPHTQIFFSANSGLQWQKIRDVTGSERTVSDIRFFNNTPNPAIIYTATNALFESYSQSHHMTRHALDYYIDNIAQAPALTSTNNRTWRTITPTSDTCTSTNPTGITVVTMASTPTVQVCKNNAGIFVTTDGGTTWHAISDDFPYAELIAISNTAPLTIIRQRCTPPNWDNRGTSPSKTCTTYQYAQIPTLAAALTSVTSTIPHGLPYEPATQHTIDPRFLTYWQHNGGLAQFGYPKTEPFYEVDEAGNILLVQYFERNRFEYHPENAGTPYTVQLGLIGNYFGAKAQQAQPGPFARQNGDTEPGQLYFAETGHTLRNAFKRHWLGTGGLAQYGYPISEEFYEVNPVDGQTYVVQYFERARFEWHPEHIGTPYEVLLGLLGSQLLSEKISE
ncbi:MAG: hypothetical protein EBS29_10235, partial [Chloroflexia bacterium]|nr:hypothetical protein [Chloroflexia bacterium]